MMSEPLNLPNGIEEWELEAFADGEALPYIERFIVQNPALWEQFMRNQRSERKLTQSLYRYDCPTLETIQSYYWNELDTGATHTIAEHLALCPHCAKEFQMVQRLVALPVAEPTSVAKQAAKRQPISAVPMPSLRGVLQEVTEQLQIVIATLLTPLTPAYATVTLRSDATQQPQGQSYTVLYEAGTTDVSLQVQQTVDNTVQIFGQILPTEPISFNHIRMIALRSTEQGYESNLDETGQFHLTELATGEHQLIISGTQQKIVIPSIDLNPR